MRPSCLRVFGDEVGQYVEDTHVHWLNMQQYLTSACIFARRVHVRITPGMRNMLVDWLWDVHAAFQVGLAAMFLTVQLVDRCLATSGAIDRADLQRVGLACLLIAAKMEDETFPSVDDLTNMSQPAFNAAKLLAMECQVCQRLHHDFTLPTAFHFVTYYSQCVAPGCTQMCTAAVAAFHALSITETWASARPQYAAAGCVAWAIRNRGLLLPTVPLPSGASVPVWEPHIRDAEEVERQWAEPPSSESEAARADRQTRRLRSACALPAADVAAAFRSILKCVQALVSASDFSSFREQWLDRCVPAARSRDCRFGNTHRACQQQLGEAQLLPIE